MYDPFDLFLLIFCLVMIVVIVIGSVILVEFRCELGHPTPVLFSNPDYCSDCGKALFIFCPDCRERYRVTPKFCHVCGHAFGDQVGVDGNE